MGSLTDTFIEKSTKLKAELKELHKQQATTNEGTENWYDYMTDLISKFMNANAKFVNGDIVDKKEILLAIGQNPVLIDGKLQITPNEWLMPLRDNTKRFVEQFEQVRTMSQQMKTDLLDALRLEWYPLADVFRTQFYEVISSIAKEVGLAKQHLGSGLPEPRSF